MQFHDMTRIDRLLSMKMMTMDASKKALTDCDDELDEKPHTPLVLRQMTQNFLNSLMAIWKTMMRQHLMCMLRQVAVFHEARELLARVKSARGYVPVVGIGAFVGLAQPSTDRKPAKSRGKGKTGKRKGKSSSPKGGKPTSLGTPGTLPKPQTSRFESRPPMSKKRPTEAGATRGHAPRLRPDQCMLCRQVGHHASECPKKGKRLPFHLENVRLVPMFWVCAVFDSQCFGATVEEIEQDQDEEDIEDFVAFSIKSLEGFAILDAGATKTVSGLMSVQPNQSRGTTIETTDVGFTFAGGETEEASTKI